MDFIFCGLDGHRLANDELVAMCEEMLKIYRKIGDGFSGIYMVKEHNIDPVNNKWISAVTPEEMWDISKNTLDNEFLNLDTICKRIVAEYSIDEFSRV